MKLWPEHFHGEYINKIVIIVHYISIVCLVVLLMFYLCFQTKQHQMHSHSQPLSPLVPSVLCRTFGQNINFNLRRDPQKIHMSVTTMSR